MLEIHNLSIKIQDRVIVDDLSFNIEAGQIMALIGESGSGKSMTALSIMRLLPDNAAYSPSAQIRLHHSEVLILSEQQMRRIRGRGVAMIFQDPMTSLNPVLTVGQHLSEVIKLQNQWHGREIYIQALRLLDQVKISKPEWCYAAYPHELSGGMKQRVMIAMALAGKPSLLIADEPTTALDVTTQAQILKLISELRTQINMSVLLITHDLAVAAQLADKIAVMQNGKLVEQNNAAEFFAGPKHPYSQKLLASSPASFSTKGLQVDSKKQTILKVQDLKVYFPIKSGILRRTVGYIKAVDGVDFTLNAGETLALVGESGCGKTTTGKAILNLVARQTGNMEFIGAQASDLQLIFQDPYAALNPKLMIIDSLQEGMLIRKQMKNVDDLLLQVGLKPEYKWRYPHEFSGGERQRLCIARALSVDPKIIVCDEPTSSLDVSIQAQVLKLLRELQERQNLSYIFISHDLAVVSRIAHRIAVMYQGKIVEHGLAADILTNPQHAYTQQLLAAVPRL